MVTYGVTVIPTSKIHFMHKHFVCISKDVSHARISNDISHQLNQKAATQCPPHLGGKSQKGNEQSNIDGQISV